MSGSARLIRGARPVVVDLSSIQSPEFAGRGIGRYSYELALALERVRPDIVAAYLLDERFAPPGPVEELLASGKLVYSSDPAAAEALGEAVVFHSMASFERARPLSAARPPAVDDLGLATSVVCYDLIPLRLRATHLADPADERRYLASLAVFRQADLVMAISLASEADAVMLGGIEPARCEVIGTGVSAALAPPPSRDEVLARLVDDVDGLEGPFVLCIGGSDGRKNLDGLVAAFASLPESLGDSVQLIVTGALPPLFANHLEHLATEGGIGDRLVLTGRVSDERLRELNQATALAVVPSLAEGYGLPAAEALACGAVVAASDAPPFDEIVLDARARFDPRDASSMAEVIGRCLGDDAVRESVLGASSTVLSSWDDVARRAGNLLDGLVERARRSRRVGRARPAQLAGRARPAQLATRLPSPATRRIAIVSPFPPVPSGVAGYSAALVRALLDASRIGVDAGEAIELDCFADGLDRYPDPPEPIDGVSMRDARGLAGAEGAIGGYDEVLYVLGNSECHASALASLRRRPGVVMAHDVRMSGLLRLSGDMPGAVPGGLEHRVAAAYGGRLPPEVGSGGVITDEDQERYGLLCTRDVLVHARRLLVSSEAARRLAALDAGPELASRLGVLPFALAMLSDGELASVGEARERRATDGPDGDLVVCSFGIVDPVKRPAALVGAMAELVKHGHSARLVFVGRIGDDLREELSELATSVGLADRVGFTGSIPRDRYVRWLGEADMAVQLRAGFYGESSSVVGECLSASLPTVVSDVGWMHELPDSAVVKVPRQCAPKELAADLERIAAEPVASRRLGEAASAHARDETFSKVAVAVLRELRG